MNSYKILVVEDEKNICNFMKMIFETNDYQVIFAQNGKNGLTMFFSHNPDLVILDLGLPDMDGVDVIREIRAKNDTPIVVLSARTDESDKVEALDLGANDYVTKPFGTAELLARVRATLRNSRFQCRYGAAFRCGRFGRCAPERGNVNHALHNVCNYNDGRSGNVY